MFNNCTCSLNSRIPRKIPVLFFYSEKTYKRAHTRLFNIVMCTYTNTVLAPSCPAKNWNFPKFLP